MTTTLTIARCPQCGNVDTVFIRSDDDLICNPCRGVASLSPIPTGEALVAPRQSVLREGASAHPSFVDLAHAAPSRRLLRRIP